MRLCFDPLKDARNKTKHGLSLSLAQHAFNDPHVLIIYDRHENGEDRYHAIARVASKFLLLVHGYPDPDEEDCVRAISLREATSQPPTRRILLTPEQQAELAALNGNPDTTDIPEASDANWKNATHFYKVRKEAISLRLDADVLDWLRRNHDRYQVEINRILREKMEAEVQGR
eukprot:gene14989-15127_t